MQRSPVFLLALIALVTTACSDGVNRADPAYVAEISAWSAEREARLRAPDGWLTLVGLHWLEQGENTVGNIPEATVFLEAPGVPGHVGTLVLDQNTVTFRPADWAEVLINGEAVDSVTDIRADNADGGPDEMSVGRLTAFVISRGDRFAVRVKDPEATTLTDFTGIQAFAVDPSFRVVAQLEAYDAPRSVSVPTAVGTEDALLCPGTLHFTINGADLTLQPWIDSPGQQNLFIVFRDETSGASTYGAGRFLTATLEDDNTAILDFNRAFSPPCAFTPYATCPLAPPENSLPIPVSAGEKLSH